MGASRNERHERPAAKAAMVLLIALAMVCSVFVITGEPAFAKTAKPGKIKASTVKRTKATVNSMTVSFGKSKNAKKYQVRYKRAGAKKWKSVKTTKRSTGLKGLKKYTKYSVQVRGINGKKKGAWTKAKTFTTLGDVYTLRFDPEEGKLPENEMTRQLRAGQTIGKLPEPTVMDDEQEVQAWFVRWRTRPDGKGMSLYDHSLMPAGNITAYADYPYDSNGMGGEELAPVQIESGYSHDGIYTNLPGDKAESILPEGYTLPGYPMEAKGTLPENRKISTERAEYRLADYNGDNVLNLHRKNAKGTLQFVTADQVPYRELSVLIAPGDRTPCSFKMNVNVTKGKKKESFTTEEYKCPQWQDKTDSHVVWTYDPCRNSAEISKDEEAVLTEFVIDVPAKYSGWDVTSVYFETTDCGESDNSSMNVLAVSGLRANGTYKVTYDVNAKTRVERTEDTNLSLGKWITLPRVGENSEQAFRGWFDGDQKVGEQGDPYRVEGDADLVAKWGPIVKPYALTYTIEPAEADSSELQSYFDQKYVGKNANVRLPGDEQLSGEGRMVVKLLANGEEVTPDESGEYHLTVKEDTNLHYICSRSDEDYYYITIQNFDGKGHEKGFFYSRSGQEKIGDDYDPAKASTMPFKGLVDDARQEISLDQVVDANNNRSVFTATWDDKYGIRADWYFKEMKEPYEFGDNRNLYGEVDAGAKVVLEARGNGFEENAANGHGVPNDRRVYSWKITARDASGNVIGTKTLTHSDEVFTLYRNKISFITSQALDDEFGGEGVRKLDFYRNLCYKIKGVKMKDSFKVGEKYDLKSVKFTSDLVDMDSVIWEFVEDAEDTAYISRKGVLYAFEPGTLTLRITLPDGEYVGEPVVLEVPITITE